MNKYLFLICILGLLLLSLHPETLAQRKKTNVQASPTNNLKSDFQAMRWRNIGPFRGGRSVAAAGVVRDPYTYYMGSTGGGLWKTEDGGINWRNVSDGFFKTGSVGAVEVSESDPNVIYVGMGEHAVRGVMTSYGDGVYKSNDGGQTWEHLGLEKTRHISRIRIHPNNPDVVFVAAQGALHGKSEERGIYKSLDGGKTWEKVLYINDLTGASDLSMDMNNPRILYASTWEHIRYPWQVKSGGEGSGIYKSTDEGKTWQKLKNGLPNLMGKSSVSVSRANSNRLYANIEAEKGGVYRSDNGGKSWTLVNTSRITQARSWYYMEVFADPQDVETVYVLNAPALRSTDGGKSFQPMPTPHGDNHDLWINPRDNQIMINANDGGANISFNGGRSWSSQQNQATAQFYRVITDNRFPYFVYGGQQDNSSVAIASRSNDAGIDWKDWYRVAGCESAYLAFNPDNPRYILGGCYQGLISLYDHLTQEQRNVMAYPILGLGTTPKEVQYRFNWNAPILASLHDPNTFYHAGNVLFKTQDLGQSWEIISEDLTRNDKSKQEKGGIPFTNEAAGGEVYNTIMYVAESPHEKGTIWVGSDDGLVHLTRDEGKTWVNVSPPNLGESMINSIEVSSHNAAQAYLVATRYKFNDLTPMVYQTKDYGKTWTKIVKGISSENFVRVVREDPVRAGLLYAGTETGLYISFDGGQNWNNMQLNLPITPITDLTIRNNDLVAATAGRAFWILDDLGPFQQYNTDLKQDSLYVYKPRDTPRMNGLGPEEVGGRLPSGVGGNPPNGVAIYYNLAKKLDTTHLLSLEILNAQGEVIRTINNQKEKNFKAYEGGPAPKQRLSTKKGMNRFVWNLRRDGIPPIPNVFVFGDYRGHKVKPGKYQARFKYNEYERIVDFEVLADPRLKASAADFSKQQAALLKIEKAVIDIHKSVNQMRKAQDQIKLWKNVLKDREDAQELLEKADELMKKMKAWEEGLIQPQQKTFQDVINYPNKLNADFLFLRGVIDAHDPRITQGQEKRLGDLLNMWNGEKQELNKLVNEDVKEMNRLFQQLNVPHLVVPQEKGSE